MPSLHVDVGSAEVSQYSEAAALPKLMSPSADAVSLEHVLQQTVSVARTREALII